MESLTAVVLAAGQGTRMKSQWPKVLHKVCGVPMAEQVIRTVKKAGSEKCVVVTGFKEELVRERLAGEKYLFRPSGGTAGDRPCGDAGGSFV